MKKRMLALALAAAMMVGVLTSCSNGGSTSGGTSGNSSDGALNITWGAGTLGGTIQLLSTAVRTAACWLPAIWTWATPLRCMTLMWAKAPSQRTAPTIRSWL
mgnify:CR=1 FL=1